MIRKILRYNTLCLLLILGSSEMRAQKITVNAHLDTTYLWIGQQTRLSLELTLANDTQKVTLPAYFDTIPGGLEVVEPFEVDSSRTADGQLLIKQSYLITAFEDSLYYVRPLPFVSENDTFWSNPLSLKVVQPFEIDTTNNSITDIKPIYQPPFYWGKIIRNFLLALLTLVVLAVLYWLIRKYTNKNKNIQDSPGEVDLGPPAHIIALEQLRKIEEEKEWEKGKIKETYTALSDTLRTYFSKRFSFNAMEMTSEDILKELSFMRKKQKEIYNKLSSILQTSDLVKFAKLTPLHSETEKNLKDAFVLVEETKQEETIVEEESGKVVEKDV